MPWHKTIQLRVTCWSGLCVGGKQSKNSMANMSVLGSVVEAAVNWLRAEGCGNIIHTQHNHVNKEQLKL